MGTRARPSCSSGSLIPTARPRRRRPAEGGAVKAPRAAAAGPGRRERHLGRDLAWGLVCVTALLLPSAPAQAATFFRSATTAQNGNGSTSLAISVPAGVVAGDVM